MQAHLQTLRITLIPGTKHGVGKRENEMKSKNELFKHGVRAAIVVLTTLVCYASVASTSAQESMSGQWMLETKPGADRIRLPAESLAGAFEEVRGVA